MKNCPEQRFYFLISLLLADYDEKLNNEQKIIKIIFFRDIISPKRKFSDIFHFKLTFGRMNNKITICQIV